MKGPLSEALIKLQQKNTVSFHTPGHKNGRLFHLLSEPWLPESFPDWDTTEIPGTDYLHEPKGVIWESQEKAADFFGAEESFFLVNGSTCGIYSMIMAVAKPGDELIVQRNSHQSIYNGCFLADVTPRYMMPQVDENTGMILGVTEQEVREALERWPKAQAVLLTSPNYYGFTVDVTAIAAMVHRQGKKLLVDEAHGSHLVLDPRLPTSALKAGADLVVQSTHKTLPALTQASMLHLQGKRIDRPRLKQMLRIHQSSSPSYILMASLDATVALLEKHGKTLMDQLLENLTSVRSNLENISCLEVAKPDDPTRLWLNMHGTGLSGYEWNNRLAEEYQIMMEMADPMGILAVTSIGNEKEDFDRLVSSVMATIERQSKNNADYPVENLGSQVKTSYTEPVIQRLTPRQAMQAEVEEIQLEKAAGRISAEMLAPYPPGIPVIMPGEEVTQPLLDWLKTRKEFTGKRIKVIK
ncbi:MAG: aminotransferase class I/II-fold pyridoxal phosphate-dependent enzyme [Tindallia sp. MSAO_Bac2]|nr:MAG: aminotransferase class I/II-fold pyridoxal phosphate-dependent enzyme [Tindallia sp. MSAO_Bac2]